MYQQNSFDVEVWDVIKGDTLFKQLVVFPCTLIFKSDAIICKTPKDLYEAGYAILPHFMKIVIGYGTSTIDLNKTSFFYEEGE